MSLRGMANVVSQYYFDAPTAQIIEPKRSALIFGYVGKTRLADPGNFCSHSFSKTIPD